VDNDKIEPSNAAVINEDDEFEEPFEGIETKITTHKISQTLKSLNKVEPLIKDC
jgi:hypothetical protein